MKLIPVYAPENNLKKQNIKSPAKTVGLFYYLYPMFKPREIIPYAIAATLAFLLFKSCGRANTLQDTLKQREALELSEKYWQDKADSLSKNIKVRIDTLYITRTKLKTRNDTIYISQGKVGNLNADSSFIFFSKYTGATVIRD